MIQRGVIRFRRPSLMLFLTAIFIFWAGTSALRGTLGAANIVLISSYVQIFIMVFFIWQLCRTQEQHLALFQAFVLGSYVLAGSTIYSYITHPFVPNALQGYERYNGIGGNANGIANIMALAIPIAWHLSLTSRNNFMRLVNLAYLPAGVLGIILTASRGGFIVAVMGLVLIIPLTLRYTNRSRKIIVVLSLALMCILVIRLVPPKNFERIAQTRSEITEGNFSNRSQIWRAGLEAYSEKPIFGVGTGAFKDATTPILGYSIDAHNVYVLILTEMGIVGITLFLLILAITILPLLRLGSPESPFYLALWLGLILSISVSNDENAQHLWTLLAIMTTRYAYVLRFSGETLKQLPRRTRMLVQRPMIKPPTR